MPAPPFQGWLPAAVRPHGSSFAVRWLPAVRGRWDAPFYAEATAAPPDAGPWVETSLDLVNDIARQTRGGMDPSGFIFHMSRCGSTLIQNALRCIDGAFVPGEPQPVGFLLDSLPPGPRKDRLLQSMVKVLGQRRRGAERRFMIKFTSLGVLHLQTLRRLWPKVPWLFVYRDPIDVVVSNVVAPGQWMKFPPARIAALFGWKTSQVESMLREEFTARTVARFCQEALRHADRRATFLSYPDIGLETLVRVAKAFGTSPGPSERRKMAAALRMYSKDSRRERVFSPDSDAKRRTATPALLEAVRRWAAPTYNRLERHPRRLHADIDFES